MRLGAVGYGSFVLPNTFRFDSCYQQESVGRHHILKRVCFVRGFNITINTPIFFLQKKYKLPYQFIFSLLSLFPLLYTFIFRAFASVRLNFSFYFTLSLFQNTHISLSILQSTLFK